MTEQKSMEINPKTIQNLLEEKKAQIQTALKICAHCTMCAESCFLFMTRDQDPKYMPSYKFINSIGTLYNKKGRVDRESLNKIRDIVWKDCVLCTRCYCPMGIDIPAMIAHARNICRSQGVVHEFDAS